MCETQAKLMLCTIIQMGDTEWEICLGILLKDLWILCAKTAVKLKNNSWNNMYISKNIALIFFLLSFTERGKAWKRKKNQKKKKKWNEEK